MANTLTGGSPTAPSDVADFTRASIAIRQTTLSPTDGDWGGSPPPVGTLILESDGILWIKTATLGGWKAAVLF